MIKLIKLKPNPQSDAPQAQSVEEYRVDQERGTYGQFHEGKSPPVDYWVVGEMIGSLEIGKGLLIDRYNRNGVVMRGTMMTSPIQSIVDGGGGLILTTANSVYLLEEVSDEECLNLP